MRLLRLILLSRWHPAYRDLAFSTSTNSYAVVDNGRYTGCFSCQTHFVPDPFYRIELAAELHGHTAQGLWTEDHINVLEMRAVLLALIHFQSLICYLGTEVGYSMHIQPLCTPKHGGCLPIPPRLKFLVRSL